MKTALITSFILSALSGQVSAPSPAEISASVKTHGEVTIQKTERTEKKNISENTKKADAEKKDTTKVYPVVLETTPTEKETTPAAPTTTATPTKNIAEAPASSTLVSANLGRGGTLAILSVAPQGGVSSLPYENEGPVSVGTGLTLLVLASALGIGGFLLSRREYLEHISQVVWQ